MKRKKQIVLEKVLVEDYAAEGKSLSRVDGKVIFIENAVPGDLVDLRLLKNKKDWAEGVVVKFHSLSSDRVEPFCPHFGVCGGCQWQMLPYQKQLMYKQRQVEETLKRIGKLPLPGTLPIIGAAETRYYRNKLEYTFGTKEFTKEKPTPTLPKGGLINAQGQLNEKSSSKDIFNYSETSQVLPFVEDLGGASSGGFRGAGFHAKGFFDKIVDITTCFLQQEPTNAIRLSVKDFAIKNNWSFYDIRNHTGFLRTMQVRLCTTGELMINIVVAEKDEEKIKLLMEHVLQLFPTITTLLYTINTKWNDSLHDLLPVTWQGKGFVIEKLFTHETRSEAFQFKIGPKSFFQTNTKQAEQLYRVAAEFAELTGSQTVYDLYCGTGSIGIFLSKNANKLIGVDVLPAAISDARENAALNDINSAEYFTGDVIDICNDDFFAAQGRPDVIITDPPRAGMHEKLVKKIADIAAPLVVYISCNPATQARDLNLLAPVYEVTKVQPVDMFPHTHHIENVVQLKLKKNV